MNLSPFRHCDPKRSEGEAIQGSPHRLLDCFVAKLLTMTTFAIFLDKPGHAEIP